MPMRAPPHSSRRPDRSGRPTGLARCWRHSASVGGLLQALGINSERPKVSAGKRGGAAPRRKGVRAEREVVALYVRHGVMAERGPIGRSDRMMGDVVLRHWEGSTVTVEVKKRHGARAADFARTAWAEKAAVVWKADSSRGGWRVLAPLHHWQELLGSAPGISKSEIRSPKFRATPLHLGQWLVFLMGFGPVELIKPAGGRSGEILLDGPQSAHGKLWAEAMRASAAQRGSTFCGRGRAVSDKGRGKVAASPRSERRARGRARRSG